MWHAWHEQHNRCIREHSAESPPILTPRYCVWNGLAIYLYLYIYIYSDTRCIQAYCNDTTRKVICKLWEISTAIMDLDFMSGWGFSITMKYQSIYLSSSAFDSFTSCYWKKKLEVSVGLITTFLNWIYAFASLRQLLLY